MSSVEHRMEVSECSSERRTRLTPEKENARVSSDLVPSPFGIYHITSLRFREYTLASLIRRYLVVDPSLEDDHRDSLRLRESVGEDESCRSSTDDDVVEPVNSPKRKVRGCGAGCWPKRGSSRVVRLPAFPLLQREVPSTGDRWQDGREDTPGEGEGGQNDAERDHWRVATNRTCAERRRSVEKEGEKEGGATLKEPWGKGEGKQTTSTESRGKNGIRRFGRTADG